jgi:hypothetical protein
MRLPLLAPLTVLTLLLGCAESPTPPTLTLQPVAPLQLAGQPTVVTARIGAGCQSFGSLAIEAADGSALPPWLTLKVDRFTTARPTYTITPGIANPGTGSPFDTGGGSTFDPATAYGLAPEPGGREFTWSSWDGLQLVFTAAAGAPATPVALRVSMVACGEPLSQSFTLSVVGAIDLGPFCGWSTGESCATDLDCMRGGWVGQVCIAARSTDTLAVTGVTCSDPVPTGARCGCTSGLCAWR